MTANIHHSMRVVSMYLYGFRWIEGATPDCETIKEELFNFLHEHGHPLKNRELLFVTGSRNHFSIDIKGDEPWQEWIQKVELNRNNIPYIISDNGVIYHLRELELV